jgi:hypothetical protein
MRKLSCLISSLRLNSSYGTSLAELLVSAAIMAFALSVIVLSSFRNVTLNESSRNLTIATSHADHVLEDIRNATFSNVCSSIYTDNWNWGVGYATTIASKGLSALNNESIHTTTTTSSVSCATATILDITVQVNWNDVQQRAQSQSFRTQVTANP